MIFAICLFIISSFTLATILSKSFCKECCLNKSKKFSIIDDIINPSILILIMIIIGSLLLVNYSNNRANKIIENIEFYPDKYKAKCKVTIIDNKADTVYYLIKRK